MQVLGNRKLLKGYREISGIYNSGPEKLKLCEQNIVFENLTCFV